MAVEDIKGALISALTEIQEASGRPAPDFHGGFCPMVDMEGFDSYNAVEVSFLLSSSLGCDVDMDVELFVDEGRPRTIDEIVKLLSEIVPVPEGGSDE